VKLAASDSFGPPSALNCQLPPAYCLLLCLRRGPDACMIGEKDKG
jgi:hypothetical protein